MKNPPQPCAGIASGHQSLERSSLSRSKPNLTLTRLSKGSTGKMTAGKDRHFFKPDCNGWTGNGRFEAHCQSVCRGRRTVINGGVKQGFDSTLPVGKKPAFLRMVIVRLAAKDYSGENADSQPAQSPAVKKQFWRIG